MSTSDPITRLFQAAREHQPFGDANSLGFATRLREAMRQPSPTAVDYLARFSWQFSIACVPVLLIASIFFGLRYQDGLFPMGLDEFVHQWAGLIPLSF